jgi:hypothetical protein
MKGLIMKVRALQVAEKLPKRVTVCPQRSDVDKKYAWRGTEAVGDV